MEIALDTGSGHSIQAYEADCIQVDDQKIHENFILSPQHLITSWPVQHARDMTLEQFKPILELKPRIVVLAMNDQTDFTPEKIQVHLSQCGIGLEIMSIAAACRTYTVLMAEQRAVVAAFILQKGNHAH